MDGSGQVVGVERGKVPAKPREDRVHVGYALRSLQLGQDQA